MRTPSLLDTSSLATIEMHPDQRTAFRRVARGWWWDGPAALDALARATALTVVHPGVILSGRWSLVARGVEMVPTALQDEAVVDRGEVRPAWLGLRAAETALPAADELVPPLGLVLVDGSEAEVPVLRLACPAFVVRRAVPRLPEAMAVWTMESVLRAGLTTAAELRAEMAGLSARRLQCLSALVKVDVRSRSPLETAVRLVLAEDPSIPRPSLNEKVWAADGSFVGLFDFSWAPRGVVGEADSAAFHDDLPAAYVDRAKQNRAAAEGLTVLRFTWRDLKEPEALRARVRKALGLR